jgi:peptidoglycan-associated lipoprotein
MAKTSLIWMAAAVFAAVACGCGPSYPKCDDDGDCHQGEYCVNGMCQQCRENADCPTGQQCAQGRCEAIEKYCDDTGDCGVDEECRANRCVPRQSGEGDEVSDLDSRPFPPGPCNIEPVYFAFVSSDLDPSAREKLAGNASCIREREIKGVHLTGFTDPRGTEEYNLALGDRRATSAKKYLKSLGVEGDIDHSSVGEEMAQGNDETGWARDRRVEFEQR